MLIKEKGASFAQTIPSSILSLQQIPLRAHSTTLRAHTQPFVSKKLRFLKKLRFG